MQTTNNNPHYRITLNDREEYVDQNTAEFERGIIRLNKPIDEDVHKHIDGAVTYRLSKYPGEPIYIIINSPGGHVTDGLAILDTLNGAKAMGSDVYTIATGMTASMGAFLLAAGTKGCRYATPNAEILLHQPLGGVSGQATDMVIAVDNIVKKKSILTEHLANFTGQSAKELAPKLERDHIMTPEQAVSEGVIDGIENIIKIIQVR